MTEDEKHLRLLSIFHYVYGGFSLLMTAGVIVALGMFAWLASTSAKPPRASQTNPKVALALMGIMFGLMILWMLAHVVCTFLAGKFLAARRHRLFCIVIAALNCMSVPLGTTLGVFTIIVLTQPAVCELFERPSPPASSP